jgi:hypothetical protein
MPRDYALSLRGRVVHTMKAPAAGHAAYLIGVAVRQLDALARSLMATILQSRNRQAQKQS